MWGNPPCLPASNGLWQMAYSTRVRTAPPSPAEGRVPRQQGGTL